jgi:hypothetical protein
LYFQLLSDQANLIKGHLEYFEIIVSQLQSLTKIFFKEPPPDSKIDIFI